MNLFRKSLANLLMPAVILLLPTLVLFWELVLAGRVLFWGVPLLQFVPWYGAAVDAVQAGTWPLWNSLVGNGAPLLANYQVAPFYPPNWLHLVVDPPHAMSWLMVLHVLWAGVGMWLYGKALGLRPFARLVSALSFMLSGYLVSRLAFASIGSALPWLPWLFWAAERLVQRPGARPAALLGLCLGMQWLAGHAQTSFYSGLALGGYLLWRWLITVRHGARPERGPVRWSGTWLWLLAAGLIGLGLAAVQLLPTAELQQLSQRAAGVEPDFALTYSLWPWRVIAFFAPRFFGHPASGNYWGYCCNYWEDNGYAGLLPLVLALGAAAAWIGRKTKGRQLQVAHQNERGAQAETDSVPVANALAPFFVLLALVSLLLALGVHTPAYPFLFERVPGFGQFQAPARLLCLWTLAVAALAGIGAQGWRPTARAKKAGRYGIVVGLALLIAAGGATQVLTGNAVTFVVATAQLGGMTGLIGLLALLQPRPADADRKRTMRWEWLVLLFVAADLVLANWGSNPTVESWLYTRPTQSAAALRAAGLDGRVYYPAGDEYAVTWERFLSFESFGPGETGPWRGMREALLPNTAALEGLPAANNFDPLRPARHEALMEVVDATRVGSEAQLALLRMMGVQTLVTTHAQPGLSQVYANGDVVFSAVPDPLPRAYVVFDARAVSSPAEAQRAIGDSAFDPGRTVVLEMEQTRSGAGDRLWLPATIQDQGTTVTVQALLPADGYLVLLDTFYPGWHALVDGQPAPILAANLAFRAVPLPAGKHVVEFRYRPASFQLGGAISGFTTLLLAAGLMWVGFRPRGRGRP